MSVSRPPRRGRGGTGIAARTVRFGAVLATAAPASRALPAALLAASLVFAIAAVLAVPGPASALGSPDLALAPADLSFSRTDPAAGEVFTMHAHVRNVGDGDGSGVVQFYTDLPVILSESGGLVGKVNVTVPSGGSVIASVNLSLPAGTHTLSAYVPPSNVTPPDADPSNNLAWTTIAVLPSSGSGPTLRLQGTTMSVAAGTTAVVPLSVTAMGGRALGVSLFVLDSAGLSAEAADPPFDIDNGSTVQLHLRVRLPVDPARGHWRLLLQAVGTNAQGNPATVELAVSPPPDAGPLDGPAAVALVVLGASAVLVGAVSAVEWARYRFLLLFLPLYTKLRKEAVLDQYTRGKIHGFIVANPGDYFASIAKALDVPAGTLAYHLRVLEREGHVFSRKQGVHRAFYPRGAKVDPAPGGELSPVERAICEVVRKAPGVRGKDIASSMGITPPTVSYHLRRLVDRTAVRARRHGMAVRYYPTSGQEPASSVSRAREG